MMISKDLEWPNSSLTQIFWDHHFYTTPNIIYDLGFNMSKLDCDLWNYMLFYSSWL